jgi:uncharacterized membrane protein YphA (DoxX/SURF4 family)
MRTSQLIDIALLLNRISLGLLFLLAGVRKLIPTVEAGLWEKWNGFAGYVASQAPLHEALGKAYGFALPPVEILAGLLLIIGLFSRVSAVVIALMLLSFIIAMGIAWWPVEGAAYDKNVIYFTLALLLAAAGAGKYSIDARRPARKG